MASNVPVVKQAAWLSLAVQLPLLALFIYASHLLAIPEPSVAGLTAYLILSFTLRNLVARSHRAGMQLVKQHQFAAAIPCFEQSVAFFTRHKWVDKYRFLTLLSSSQVTYWEMGLCNLAFCYGQTGQGRQAKAYYEQVLAAFPDNGLAQAGVNMLNSLGPQASAT